MSNWQYEDMGDFADEAAAENWARRNNVNLSDIRTSRHGKTVSLQIRRSALGDSGANRSDMRDGRRAGW